MSAAGVVVTFNKVARGEFEVLVDGVKSEYAIYNGCLGLSGRDSVNIYVVTRKGETTKLSGSLQACKKGLVFTLGRGRDLSAGAVEKVRYTL